MNCQREENTKVFWDLTKQRRWNRDGGWLCKCVSGYTRVWVCVCVWVHVYEWTFQSMSGMLSCSNSRNCIVSAASIWKALSSSWKFWFERLAIFYTPEWEKEKSSHSETFFLICYSFPAVGIEFRPPTSNLDLEDAMKSLDIHTSLDSSTGLWFPKTQLPEGHRPPKPEEELILREADWSSHYLTHPLTSILS